MTGDDIDRRPNCPWCQAAVPVSAKFCPVCGHALEHQPEPLADSEPDTAIVLRLERIERHLVALDQRLARLERAAPQLVVHEPRPAAPAPPAAAPRPVAATPGPVAPSRPWPPLPSPPSPPARRRVARRWSEVDLEDLLSGRGLAWLGGLALVVGAIFFLSLAFSRGWIGPAARVTIGLVAGALLLAGGGWLFERRERVVGPVLVAVGLSVFSLSLLAGSDFYDLFSTHVALLGTFVAASAAAVIAVRAGSQVVAIFGLVAALAAPPLLGAEPDGVTIAFLSIVLAGTTAIALYRNWRWLAPVAFALSAPQLADWVLSNPAVAPALLAAWGFWLLHALAAGGEEYRVPRDRLHSTSATLLLANVAFLVWAGFRLLEGDLASWRGPFLVGVSLAHAAIAAYFLVVRGQRHPFGLLAAGTSLATLSIAVPVQFGGPVVPIAWAAEAAALAWVYSRLRNGYVAGAAVVLGAAAAAHLALIEYPFWEIDAAGEPAQAFLNGNAATAGFLLAALAVAGWFVSHRLVRTLLAASGVGLVTYVLPFELSGAVLVGGWSALWVIALLLWREPAFRPDVRGVTGRWRTPAAGWAAQALATVAGVVAACAALHLTTIDLPSEDAFARPLPEIPFADGPSLAAAFMIVAALAGAWVVRAWDRARGGQMVAAAAVAAYLLVFEVREPAVVAGCAALAVAVALLVRWDAANAALYRWSSLILLGSGALLTLTRVAPLDRLAVDATSTIDHPLLWSGATVAGVALAAAAVVAARALGDERTGRWLLVAAAVAIVYTLSVNLVDEFQRQVGGATALEELKKRAQVGLSILWAMLGVAAFVAGIALRSGEWRWLGLGLLGVAAVKVFVVDLASLDAAYRVLSFVGLGILLLLSSWAYQHWMPRLPGPDGRHGPAAGAGGG